MKRAAALAMLRIGWRSIGRSRWRSALIVLLVMLPVAAMVGASTLARTTFPTPEASATNRMGQADFIAYPRSPDVTSEALEAVLPSGARIEPMASADGRLVLPGREASVGLRAMDLDGLAAGMLRLTDGRLPDDRDEVAVSRAVATVAGVGIGDRIELKGWGESTIVGFVEDPFYLSGRLVLEPSSLAPEVAPPDEVVWLVALPPGTDADALDLGTAFAVVTRAQAAMFPSDSTAAILVFGGLALIEAVLIAAAAFAVSIRRRQRDLGLLAAAGAEWPHLAGTVLAEGILLGTLGALAGVVAGVAGVLALSPWFDELTNRRIPPVTVDPAWILLAAGIGVFAALLAAAVPAWTAARLPVLVALSGRRPAPNPARRMLLVGIVLIAVGVALTAGGAAMRRDWGDQMGVLLLLAGAVVGILGFGAWSPWLVESFDRLGARLPAAGRIALRDTARARSRSGPIVTAILASLAATVALAAYIASTQAVSDAKWKPWARPDQILLAGEDAVRLGPSIARELGAISAAPIPSLTGSADPSRAVEFFYGDGLEGAPDVTWEGDRWEGGGTSCADCVGAAFMPTIGDTQLLAAFGAESATGDLDRGMVVLSLQQPLEVRQVTAVISSITSDTGQPRFVESVALPARVVVTGIGEQHYLPDALISPGLAARLGFATGEGNRYVFRLGHPVGEADLAQAAALVAPYYPETWADASLGPPHPGEGLRWLMLIGSLLLALSVTGIAVALGEAESRPDQRTLLAVGADPGIWRRIAAARAGVLALLAGALAVPAGLLPTWGLLASRDGPLVVPLPEVMVAIVLLPLAGIVGALLISRPIPAWSALREVGR